MSYGIIFWGNLSQNNYIFKIQKEQFELLWIQAVEPLLMNY